jgi:hypothetical protein
MPFEAPGRASRVRDLAAVCALALGSASLVGPVGALAHEQVSTSIRSYRTCPTAGPLSSKSRAALTAPFNEIESFRVLQGTTVWKTVVSQLLVNRDKQKPCYGFSDTPEWTKVVSRIPTNVLAVQTNTDRTAALIYVSGLPGYLIETPKVFASFKPGDTYGIFRVATAPTVDTRPTHDFADKGAIGIFVNGVSMFNYTDTFAYANKGVWSYDANVAEALIVNSDISHATPSNLPQFPKSRGIFHNHQMSIRLLNELKDPYFSGRLAHSKLVGFAIDSYPIYGPLGYSSKDVSSGLKTLKSSYVKRTWTTASMRGSNHRSSVPAWAVVGWDNSNATGATLLNLFKKPKSDLLYADGKTDGPVAYEGKDERLSGEIKLLAGSVGLKRDPQGYVYWESPVSLPGGSKVATKNYLLKSSDLWGPDIDEAILPASYQVADKDKFYFKARIGAFAEDYEFVAGYGDLDFYNGIDSFVPERGTSIYHYVATFSGKVSDKARLTSASFPYFVGIQYKGVPDPFNAKIDNSARIAYFLNGANASTTIFDVGVTGKDDQGQPVRGAVPETWQKKLSED